MEDGDRKAGITELDVQRFELEKQRFAFEQRSDAQNRELELRRIRQSRWDTVWRFFGSAVITAGIAGAVTLYGNKVQQETNLRAQQAELAANARAEARASLEKEKAAEDRRSEVLVQLLNAREAADSSLRARMFEALLQNYFKEPDNAAKITILEMIGLNFRDSVQVRPMFELLDADLRSEDVATEALRNAASTIIEDQLKEIRGARDGEVCTYEVVELDVVEPTCFDELIVQLTEIADDESAIAVRVNSRDGQLLDKADMKRGDSFRVTYYDMPMTDYSIVESGRDSWRYSIVLRDIDASAKRARVAVAMLPVDSYSTQQEYKFDESISVFLNPDKGDRITIEEESPPPDRPSPEGPKQGR